MVMLVYQRVAFTDDFVVFFVQWQRFVQIFFLQTVFGCLLVFGLRFGEKVLDARRAISCPW